jgi:hypothetical protein
LHVDVFKRDRSADPAATRAWEAFERGLVAYLETMRDDDDHLVVETPAGADLEGTAPFAQFCVAAPGLIRAEVAGNDVLSQSHHLDDAQVAMLVDEAGWQAPEAGRSPNFSFTAPTGDLATIAIRVRDVLEDFYGVPHPTLLSAHAWGPAAVGIRLLGVPTTDDLLHDVVDGDASESPTEPAAHPVDHLVVPEDHAHLVELVRDYLRRRLRVDPHQDDDGDFAVPHDYGAIWFRVRDDIPVIDVFTRVIHQARSRSQAAIEANLLNRDRGVVKYFAADRSIYQILSLPALPFVPAQLDGLLPVFESALDDVRSDLALRTRASRG